MAGVSVEFLADVVKKCEATQKVALAEPDIGFHDAVGAHVPDITEFLKTPGPPSANSSVSHMLDVVDNLEIGARGDIERDYRAG
eukprot:9484326-Pyramimonas_sp.AAC.1